MVPDAGQIEEFREPIAKINFIVPTDCIGAIMKLCEDRRGIYKSTEYLGPKRAQLVYELPLAEIIFDMYDKLKSVTRGYGTMDYEVIGFRPADLVKMDVLVKGNRVDALSTIVHRSNAEKRGRALVQRLKGEISKHQFEIPLQAAIGSRVIARETISAMRKNVTAKCYGGDVTRKRKLLQKQHEGKKRMKQFGEVEIPQKAFLSVLEVGGDEWIPHWRPAVVSSVAVFLADEIGFDGRPAARRVGVLATPGPWPANLVVRNMTGVTQSTAGDPSGSPGARAAACGALIDALLCLYIAVVLFRTFEVEGYIISTGSMAPVASWAFTSESSVPPAVILSRSASPSTFGSGADTTGKRLARDARFPSRAKRCPNCGLDSIDSEPPAQPRRPIARAKERLRVPAAPPLGSGRAQRPARSRRPRSSSEWSDCRTSRCRLSTETSTPTAKSAAKIWTSNGRCGFRSSTTIICPTIRPRAAAVG